MARVILVSNRLPVTPKLERNRLTIEPSPGGLATGLRTLHAQSDVVWIGSPGDVSRLSTEQRRQLDDAISESRCVPVLLTPSEIAHFYDGFSNAVLWPLFHYLLDRIPTHSHDWEVYRRVNEKFAEVTEKTYRPGDLLWVHDYQLALVPRLLRRRLPSARIGFFLHIPFPSVDVFRTLPFREAILEGMLGADVVGFHTLSYRRHFASAVERILDLPLEDAGRRVRVGERAVHLGVFPMGVDVARIASLVEHPEVSEEVAHLKAEASGQSILVGVDRLDYTKGMRRRLLAFERLLERTPDLRGRVRLVQVAVPSRDQVESYQSYRREVNEHIGRINGAFGTIEWVPIHYVHRPISERHLVALYRAASVMLVTPLRDGMNLVAKEFVAARTDDDGVLVLSEFAGAAAEMGEALIINPYDVDALATACQRAIEMHPDERRFRMRALRARIATNDVRRWTQSFLDTLSNVDVVDTSSTELSTTETIDDLVKSCLSAERLLILLDYDGTLVPLASAPELAVPDAKVLELLSSLASRPGFEVHVVSGRKREALERWLGDLPIGLHAEHGYWSRALPRGNEPPQWTAAREIDVPWKTELRALLERFTVNTPGALMEEKTASVAWHYRMTERELAATRAAEVSAALGAFVRGMPLEILHGDKVIEVRVQGIDKGSLGAALVGAEPEGTAVLAMGDDVTDADLFRALPHDAATIAVGERSIGAKFRLESPAAARAFLARLLPHV